VKGLEYMVFLIVVFLSCITVKLILGLRLFESKKHAVLTLGSLFVIGSALDSLALVRGYWSYQQKFLVGVTIGLMPLEEYVFMVVIPLLTITVFRLTQTGKRKP